MSVTCLFCLLFSLALSLNALSWLKNVEIIIDKWYAQNLPMI